MRRHYSGWKKILSHLKEHEKFENDMFNEQLENMKKDQGITKNQ